MTDVGYLSNTLEGDSSPTPDFNAFYNDISHSLSGGFSSFISDPKDIGVLSLLIDTDADGGAIPFTLVVYKMRGWRTVQLNFETWFSYGSSSTTNPSGQPIIDISTAAIYRITG